MWGEEEEEACEWKTHNVWMAIVKQVLRNKTQRERERARVLQAITINGIGTRLSSLFSSEREREREEENVATRRQEEPK